MISRGDAVGTDTQQLTEGLGRDAVALGGVFSVYDGYIYLVFLFDLPDGP